MAELVHIDRIQELSCEEVDGAIVSMVREVLVTGLTGSTDYQILNEALAVDDMPASGSTPEGMPNLILVKRTPTLIPDDTGSVLVKLEYNQLGLSESNFTLRFGAALTQSTTEVMNGQPITLQHTWPADDPDEERQNRTDDQAGVMNVMDPTLEAIAVGLVEVDYPLAILHRWRGSLNSRSWMGGAAYHWQCTQAQAFPYDYSTTPITWKFTFEFAYTPYGIQPRVSFVDDRTGKPAYGLVEGVGTKEIQYYPAIDFNALSSL
uniref:Uncharacterized protein n=1 Tax=viral metagenome TaxID=1070528 RepID=A0A6M3K2Z9_9ZZZZ